MGRSLFGSQSRAELEDSLHYYARRYNATVLEKALAPSQPWVLESFPNSKTGVRITREPMEANSITSKPIKGGTAPESLPLVDAFRRKDILGWPWEIRRELGKDVQSLRRHYLEVSKLVEDADYMFYHMKPVPGDAQEPILAVKRLEGYKFLNVLNDAKSKSRPSSSQSGGGALASRLWGI